MFMNILVVIFVLAIAYAWMVRGIFNAMIHALCALVAGAIAFAFWEPLSIMLVNMSPERGFFSFIESIAWGVALVVPFAVVMLLLRVATDKLIPANIKNNPAVDYAGGAVFGAVTGVICSGILVIGVNNMRVSTEFLGYQPLWYSAERATGAGSLVKSDSLWIPVDSIVADVYGTLSEGSMSSGEPLAYWYPELELTGFASRVSPGGMGRNALRPEDFNLLGTYTVGPEQGTQVSELLKISGSSNTQRYVDINDEPVSTGRVYGYVLEFEPSAKERGRKGAGQLVVSNGQIRMLVENSNNETYTIFPNAVISESSEPGQFGRWRFDAADVFINSTGGKSKVPMGFEFVVPTGSTPVALFVKNVRIMADEFPDAVSYPTPSRRDRLVRTGSILRGNKAEVDYNTEYTVSYNWTSDENRFVDTTSRLLEILPISAARRGMTIDDDNHIVAGQGTYDVKSEVGRRNAGTSKNLRVERYAVAEDQAMIKLEVSADSPFGFLSEGAQVAPLDEPLVLLDTLGNEYEAVGYEYIDSSIMELRYTLGNTLTGIEDTPSLSTTRADQRLRIIFVITDGVEIDRFVIGDMVLAQFNPNLASQGGG